MEKTYQEISLVLKERLKDDMFAEENFSDWIFNREYPPKFSKKCFKKIAQLMRHYMCSEAAVINLYLEKVKEWAELSPDERAKVADEIMELLLYEE